MNDDDVIERLLQLAAYFANEQNKLVVSSKLGTLDSPDIVRVVDQLDGIIDGIKIGICAVRGWSLDVDDGSQVAQDVDEYIATHDVEESWGPA